jgi:O-phospho-L-threonine phospho-lyase
MKYKSTRGDIKDVSFEETVFSGFTPLGGLFVPENIPKISQEELKLWKTFSYPELCFEICSKFIDEEEISSNDLKYMIKVAFSNFSHSNICNIERNEIPILELFHGPTLSFKDYALSLLGQFIDYFLKKRSKKITIVVGTSGDTGSAAIQSVKDLSSVNIIVLYPKGRCSKIQGI